MAITATIDETLRSVTLTYTAPAGTATVTAARTSPSGAVATVRNWDRGAAVPGQVVIRDFEAPIGVELDYTVMAFNTAGTSIDTATITVTVTSSGCSDTWLNDLARVTNTTRVVMEAFPELEWPVPITVHDVISRRTPVASSDVAHTPQFEFSFLTDSLDDRDRARATLGNGVPVLLRTPPENGIGNLYFSVLGYREQRIVPGATVADRRFLVQGRQIDRPDPDLYQPVGFVIYQYVKDTFATYADLKAQRATYDAVLYDWGGAQPSDVFPWPPVDA